MATGNNVKFVTVEDRNSVVNCNENQIVFCKETGEIFTHSTRYGTPTISEIGDENPYGDIQMIKSTNSIAKSSVNSSPEPKVLSISISPNSESSKTPVPGDVYYNGKFSDLSTYLSLGIDSAEGIVIGSNPVNGKFMIVELKNTGILDWGLVGETILGLSGYSSSNEAETDYRGEENTKIVANYLKYNSKSSSPLFSSLSDGWFIPSIGQLRVLYNSLSQIQPSLNKLGDQILLNYYWSSTPGSNDGGKSAWAFKFENGSIDSGYRTSKLAVRRMKYIG